MDASAEEILTKILSIYDGNENRFVSGNYESIPIPYQGSLSLEFEKLNMYGMISNSHIWINSAWELTLTPQGIRYFKDKNLPKRKVMILCKKQHYISNTMFLYLMQAKINQIM